MTIPESDVSRVKFVRRPKELAESSVSTVINCWEAGFLFLHLSRPRVDNAVHCGLYQSEQVRTVTIIYDCSDCSGAQVCSGPVTYSSRYGLIMIRYNVGNTRFVTNPFPVLIVVLGTASTVQYKAVSIYVRPTLVSTLP